MGLVDAASRFLGMTLIERPPEVVLSNAAELAVDRIIHAREHPRLGMWRLPTVAEAMGVPSIQRAVALISSTVGMLSMQAFRNGELMTDPPSLITRPDPDQTPYEFYATTAAQAAKYGEFVWWIASRDSDDKPAALINVPLTELRVDRNPESRRFPKYQWGSIKSTRWSPANPSGQFVHKKYPLTEPFALRGEGPLQLGQIAVSISVESQIWAANFYGGGGHASDIIKHASTLDPTLRDEFGNPDEDTGLSEADRLKAQYIARDSNTPLVIDQAIDSITPGKIDQAGAQMLEARLHQNGDAARLFGLPGKFVEYVQSGTSLTYQSLESAFTDLVKTCLQPLYLEPIEQAMSDLLVRSQAARFNVKGFLRADIKTRYEVHGIAIDKGIYDPAYAQAEEGIIAGDVEYKPVPIPAPASFPSTVPRYNSAAVENWRCSNCSLKLLDLAGPGTVATCRRCKSRNEVPTAPTAQSEAPMVVNMPTQPINLAVSIPQTEMSVAAMADKVGAMTASIAEVRNDLALRAVEVDGRLAEIASAQTELATQIAAPSKRRYVPKRGSDGVIVAFDEVSAA